MNDTEVDKQIEQMVRFIKQEAEEKANEIRVSAEEEFNIEKLQLLEQEKTKIRKEYERKEAHVDVKKKIEYSKVLNEQRLKVLAAQEASIQGVLQEARTKLRDVSKDPNKYKKLLQDLLVQCFQKLKEKSVVVKCRQVDLMAVKDIIEPARKQFSSTFNTEAPTVTVNQEKFLPPPPTASDNSEGSTCCGGLVVTSGDGRIVCNNTLDDRVHIAYDNNLPDVRAILFGAVSRAR